MKTVALFDWSHSLAGKYLEQETFPWRVIPNIGKYLDQLIKELPSTYREVYPQVWVGPDTSIAPSAVLEGPIIIGARCEIRHAAFVRPQVICGDEVIIGNSTEVKNSILFDSVQIPHFNYVGDSILGYKAHLGAGAILSNFKAAGDEIKVMWSGQNMGTGLNKLGAMLGDRVEVGCNAVLYPGTIIGQGSIIYPLTPVRGTIPDNTIIKNDGKQYPKRDRE